MKKLKRNRPRTANTPQTTTDSWRRVRGRLTDGNTPADAVAEALPATSSIDNLVATYRTVRATLAGPGPDIERLLQDPRVTDVLVNPTGVWVERDGALQPARIETPTGDDARALAVRMAAACGVRLDEAKPIADGVLPDGTRLHAVLSPPARGGTLISLRTKRKQQFSLADLVENGTLSQPMLEQVEHLVDTRATTLLTGSTGSGKTTLLGAIIARIPAAQRIICIEETPELAPSHPHVVSLAAREANVQGEGAVTLTDLVHAAMRMRPDRLVLGECRGEEIRDTLAAFNTGHEGGWATLHANAPGDVPARLVALGALAGMDAATVHAQAHAGIDAVIHMGRVGGRRTVRAIGKVAPELPFRIVPVLEAGGGAVR